MKEIFKDIPGYEGLYQCSNKGMVISLPKSWKSGNGKVQSHPLKEKKRVIILGYWCVSLHKNGKAKMYKVHRIVAQLFIQNPENKPQVNHIDGNRLNCDVSNLEWVTARENVIHAIRTNLRNTAKGETHVFAKLKQRDVDEILISSKSTRELAIQYNVTYGNIWLIRKRINWKVA